MQQVSDEVAYRSGIQFHSKPLPLSEMNISSHLKRQLSDPSVYTSPWPERCVNQPEHLKQKCDSSSATPPPPPPKKKKPYSVLPLRNSENLPPNRGVVASRYCRGYSGPAVFLSSAKESQSYFSEDLPILQVNLPEKDEKWKLITQQKRQRQHQNIDNNMAVKESLVDDFLWPNMLNRSWSSVKLLDWCIQTGSAQTEN